MSLVAWVPRRLCRSCKTDCGHAVARRSPCGWNQKLTGSVPCLRHVGCREGVVSRLWPGALRPHRGLSVPAAAVGWWGGCASVGGDVGDASVVAGVACPCAAGWSDQLVGEGVSDEDVAVLLRCAVQVHEINGVLAVGRDVGDVGVFVDAEVVVHGAACDEPRYAWPSGTGGAPLGHAYLINE
jgi:hypothetical protein